MMFDRLIALSQEKTSEKRGDLLIWISELFTEGAENYTDAETRLFGDILCRLVDQVSVDVRAQFSEQMAPLSCTPRAVAMRRIGLQARMRPSPWRKPCRRSSACCWARWASRA